MRLAGNRCRHLPDMSFQIAVVAYRDAVISSEEGDTGMDRYLPRRLTADPSRP